MGIPGINDFWELAQKIRACFDLPQVKSKAQDVKNNYLVPLNPMFPCQNFREGQTQKTLAYAQALQYWVEKANPLVPG